MFGLALAGAAWTRFRGMSGFLFLLMIAASLPMTLFYVTSRQRNAVLPVAAVLAALALAELVERFRHGAKVGMPQALVAASLAAVLSVETAIQREDRFSWTTFFSYQREVVLARDALSSSRLREAALHTAYASTFRPDLRIPAAPEDVVAVTLREIKNDVESARLFNLGLALSQAGVWDLADSIFSTLQENDYVHMRRGNAVGSLSYYRARTMLHLSRGAVLGPLLASAEQEAPGDAYVLALRMLVEPSESERCGDRLRELHDPFTAEVALARAAFDAGRAAEARAALRRVIEKVPEWRLPRHMLTEAK